MDQEVIKQLAEAIAAKLGNWELSRLVWIVLATTIAAAIGAFLGKYLGKKGEQLATKEDFAELTAQLHRNTALIEDVKAEVGYKDWIRKEWVTLQRIKLEELVRKLHESEDFLDRLQHHALVGKLISESTHQPVDEIASIAALYFPRLEADVGNYFQLSKQASIDCLDLLEAVGPLLLSNRSAEYDAVCKKYRSDSESPYRKRLVARDIIKARVKQEFQTLMQQST